MPGWISVERKVDVCLLSESGEQVDQLAAPTDADALRALARRIDEIYREPVCAVIECRLVHDTLEQEGWEVEIADAQKMKGLAPLACRTDRVDSRVLAVLSQRDLVPAVWLPDRRIREERELARFRLHLVKRKSRSRTGPLGADQLRQALVRSPICSESRAASCLPTASAGALARRHHGERGADRRARRPDRGDHRKLREGHADRQSVVTRVFNACQRLPVDVRELDRRQLRACVTAPFGAQRLHDFAQLGPHGLELGGGWRPLVDCDPTPAVADSSRF